MKRNLIILALCLLPVIIGATYILTTQYPVDPAGWQSPRVNTLVPEVTPTLHGWWNDIGTPTPTLAGSPTDTSNR